MLGGVQTQLGANGAASSVIGQQASGSNSALKAQFAGQVGGSTTGAVWILLLLAGAWFVWSVIVHHTRVGERLNVANIAPSLHNWLHIGLLAATFIVVMKIAWTKLAAWKVPGASWVAQFFGAA